ncbi:hypothetical protein B4N89_14320 [Embleya scabrispora]|uniref:Uncharacterized protein n=1 Tax=Embleya scabrispora TaxID=159449 RepID=A0A1T3NYN0_9ACTN|nr:hypothetical protein [Embleya scabrispora]OPC81956.1 hypothetical protein B4N89_14320 [Embleya scabrispora]
MNTLAAGGSTVVIGLPVILLAAAFLLLAGNKAPKLAGFCLFVAGVNLSATAFAASLNDSTGTFVAGAIDAFTSALG